MYVIYNFIPAGCKLKHNERHACSSHKTVSPLIVMEGLALHCHLHGCELFCDW